MLYLPYNEWFILFAANLDVLNGFSMDLWPRNDLSSADIYIRKI